MMSCRAGNLVQGSEISYKKKARSFLRPSFYESASFPMRSRRIGIDAGFRSRCELNKVSFRRLFLLIVGFMETKKPSHYHDRVYLASAEAKQSSASCAPPQGLEPWTYGLTDRKD